MNRYLYISGPITGTDDYFQRFDECEKFILENTKYKVINPVYLTLIKLTMDDIVDRKHEDYMRASYYFLTKYPNTDIILLPNWSKSIGARGEKDLAFKLGYDFMLFLPKNKSIRWLPKEMRK